MKPAMKWEETHARTYLEHLNLGPVVHEPHGNVTPDFVVDGRIAVEVRRLNQYHFGGGKPEALENVTHAIANVVKSVMQSFGPPFPDDGLGRRCWALFYRFERPLAPHKQLRQALTAALEEVRRDRPDVPREFVLGAGASVRVIPSPILKPTMFWEVGRGDQNSGGMLMDMYQSSLDIVVAEKWAKVSKSPHRAQYPEWWLVLIDTLGTKLDDFDLEIFLDEVSVARGFDRVIIVAGNDATYGVDVPFTRSEEEM